MSPNILGEIEKYLSKKSVYFKKFSIELQAYLELAYPNLPTIKARWYMLKNNITEVPSCAYPKCNKIVKWNERKGKFDDGCCTDHNKRITSLRNFGTEHPNQSKTQQRKVRKSIQKKYGVDYITQTDKHKESVKETVRERYCVDSILQVPEIREKIKQTNLERFGVKNPISTPEVREKVKDTNLKKFGVEESLSSPEVREKINKTNTERYGSIFPMRNEELLEKRRQTIIEKYDAYSPIARKEDEKKYYHLDKSLEAENNDETYFCFFDNEIKNKQKQIEWIVNPVVNKIISNFEFSQLNFKERDNFIDNNSLYTHDSEIRQNHGVYSNNELVAIFSGYEKDDFYEITRFVVKIGIDFSENIILNFLNHIKKEKVIVITLDRRFTSLKQPTLTNIGFEFVGGTEPKKYDSENWDCGKLVYKKVNS